MIPTPPLLEGGSSGPVVVKSIIPVVVRRLCTNEENFFVFVAAFYVKSCLVVSILFVIFAW